MTHILVTLTSSSTMNHVPLAALGYALRRAGVLTPLTALELPLKTIDHTPTDKVLEGLVLILAGGRATAQANLVLRPNTGLAQAWGQAQFAEQSTLARTFDALDETSVQALQGAFAALTRTWSHTCRHDFRRGGLTLDGDLTGLPASRRAEGSTKGYFPGKKIAMGGNWRGSPHNRMANRWGPYSIPAPKRARIACNRWCR